MSAGVIIDPKKEEQKCLQDEFMQRLNTLVNNAQYCGFTHLEIIGILESFKAGIIIQVINVTRGSDKK